ncbi:hypothetical protein BD410DRAFT_780247 [Rickenella mellea]|uniref:Peroxisome assembly protein 12 n=1 Tax=Rickenella mellea TaxID=50990 RepID=A0A4R5XF43_9AGAM|nr:hypothetical protein BD410DRAFT_780247 [Rickenella mellea]
MEFFNDVGGDPHKPSIFELVAQEQLRDLLQPALKYVLSVFAQRYPRYLLRIVNRHEEFYGFLMFFIERHYLRKHGASFSENFYGLKRRRKPLYDLDRTRAAVGGIPKEEKLRNRDVRRSLFFLICLPYLRAKAQDYYEILGGGVDPNVLDDGSIRRVADEHEEEHISQRLRRVFKLAYPWINMSYELWLMSYNVAYLFERTPFYRPWLGWMGVDLRRLSADDFRLMNNAAQNIPPSTHPKNLTTVIGRLIYKSPRFLLDSLKVLLPTAIFFVKFLEWWYSPSSPARSLSASPLGPAVQAPPILKPHPQGVEVDKARYGECPLCRKMISNATALPSGYVFCYRCAYDYVEKHAKCPVTFLPARIWQLRKVSG